jgi:hypothetical protein
MRMRCNKLWKLLVVMGIGAFYNSINIIKTNINKVEY